MTKIIQDLKNKVNKLDVFETYRLFSSNLGGFEMSDNIENIKYIFLFILGFSIKKLTV